MSTFRCSVRPATVVLLSVLALALGVPAAAQSGSKKDPSKDKKSDDTTTTLTIHVVGGPKHEPVANASVYLRFKEKAALLFLLHKKKKVELDLKTDDNGIAYFAGLPQGEVLVQVVAPLWQTFGEYYELKKEKRTILIKLHRPKTDWY